MVYGNGWCAHFTPQSRTDLAFPLTRSKKLPGTTHLTNQGTKTGPEPDLYVTTRHARLRNLVLPERQCSRRGVRRKDIDGDETVSVAPRPAHSRSHIMFTKDDLWNSR
jgi:hypothetical protein